jgi:hypothetical protein
MINAKPEAKGRYEVSFKNQSDRFLGSSLTLTWVPNNKDSEKPRIRRPSESNRLKNHKKPPSANYRFNWDQSTNREPRGICLIGERISADSRDEHLPRKIIGRFPDIERITDKTARRQYIETFKEELRIELEVLKRLDHLKKFISCRLPGEDDLPELKFNYDHEKYSSPVLLCCHVEGISLREWCKQYSLSLEQWFTFARSLTKTVHMLHLEGSPHGYICPDNVIVEDSKELKNPRLINLEWDTPDPTVYVDKESAEERAKLCWRRPYDSPDKICYYREASESVEIYDPFVPGDIFSLGLTLLYLVDRSAGGSPEPLRPYAAEARWNKLPWNRITEPALKSNEAIKAEVFSRLREGFRFNGNEAAEYERIIAATEIVFACLRVSGHRFYNVRSILDVLDRFDPKHVNANTAKGATGSHNTGASNGIADAFSNLCGQIDRAQKINPPVATLYTERLPHYVRPLLEGDPVNEPGTRFTAGRSREEIVDALSGLLLNISARCHRGEKWTCKALTTPAFWFEGNCGPAGRVLSALKIAAIRGCSVNVLILLNEARMNSLKTVHIMNQHRLALEHFKRDMPEAMKKCEWGWHTLPSDQYKAFLRSHETYVSLEGPDQNKVLVVPDFASEAGQIIALRVFPVKATSDRRWKDLEVEFDKYWPEKSGMGQFPHK